MNRLPDRDVSVERLLRQSLQARRGAASTDACLDAETLAAWTDGALSLDRASAAEAHVADCSRCQAVLAGFARAMPPARASGAWGRRWRLGWLVPLATAAAAITLWIAVPRAPSRVSPQQPQTPTPTSSPTQNEQGAPAERTPAPVAVSPEGQAGADKQNAVRKIDDDRLAGAAPPREPEGREKRVTVSGETPAPDRVEPLAQGNTTRISAAPSAAPSSSTDASRSAAASPSTTRLELSRNEAAVGGIVAIEIVSPDSSTRWRIGRRGFLQYSSDGGSTWQMQSSGVTADLTAGASPSSSVCWVVGRGGTVLLSTDGRRWQRVSFPEPADLTAVLANDARTATVTTADGRTFRTADGGLTWEN